MKLGLQIIWAFIIKCYLQKNVEQTTCKNVSLRATEQNVDKLFVNPNSCIQRKLNSGICIKH